MSHIAKRRVKGRQYYYLEESVKEEGKWRKESLYLGSARPDNPELRKKYAELIRKLAGKGITNPTPPLTEFISKGLGEKIQNAANVKGRFLKKLSPRKRKEFIQRERITFITDSNAIEGSTLGYTETENAISGEKRMERLKRKGIMITGMGREEGEALSLDKCLNYYEKYLGSGKDVSEEMILQLHLVLLRKIEGYEKYAGIWRPVNVMVHGSDYKFPEHQQVPALMKSLMRWYNENRGLIHGVELAATLHTRFTTIHPFADGNGRIARLLMNYVLQLNGFPFTNIPLKRRDAYMKTQASGNLGNHMAFTLFLAGEVIKQNSLYTNTEDKRKPNEWLTQYRFGQQ